MYINPTPTHTSMNNHRFTIIKCSSTLALCLLMFVMHDNNIMDYFYVCHHASTVHQNHDQMSLAATLIIVEMTLLSVEVKVLESIRHVAIPGIISDRFAINTKLLLFNLLLATCPLAYPGSSLVQLLPYSYTLPPHAFFCPILQSTVAFPSAKRIKQPVIVIMEKLESQMLTLEAHNHRSVTELAGLTSSLNCSSPGLSPKG